MRIAVNARLLLQNRLEGIGWHAFELISRMIEMNPQHRFILFYDRRKGILIPKGKNVESRIIRPVTRIPLLLNFWTNFSLAYAIKSAKAELFYSPEPILPSRLNIPSIITIHDLSPQVLPDSLPGNHGDYYRQILKRNATLATAIVTVSEFSKKEICSHYPIRQDKVHVIYNAARDVFKPLPMEEQQKVRDQLTNGKKYFVSLSALHQRKNVDKIIKAFDAYQADNYADHKLVIIGKRMGKHDLMDRAIKKSKFKKDIVQTGYLDEEKVARILAAAEALINLSEYEGFGMQLVEAMQSGVPVIASDKSCYPEICDGHAILVDPVATDDIAITMHDFQIIKKQLSSGGIERAKDFDWNVSAHALSQIMQSLVTNT